jgi:hypothetical protein
MLTGKRQDIHLVWTRTTFNFGHIATVAQDEKTTLGSA